MPGASGGATATLTILDLEVTPSTNEVRVHVDEGGSSPELDIDPGETTGDSVTYKYHATESGEKYLLKSLSEEVVRDSETASSPVTLVDDDSDELLEIVLDSSGSGGGGGGSGGGSGGSGVVVVGGGEDAGWPGVPLAVVMVLLGLSAVGWAADTYIEDDEVVIGVVATAGLFAAFILAEALTVQSQLQLVLEPIGEGLGQVAALAGIVAIALGAYYFYLRFIKGQQPRDIVVQGRLK